MSEKARHIEALSAECEKYLAEHGMYSVADHKDETDPADIFTAEGELVVRQVPRDIPLYYLMRLVDAAPSRFVYVRMDFLRGRVAQANQIYEALELAAGDQEPPPWVSVFRVQMEGIAEAVSALEDVIYKPGQAEN